MSEIKSPEEWADMVKEWEPTARHSWNHPKGLVRAFRDAMRQEWCRAIDLAHASTTQFGYEHAEHLKLRWPDAFKPTLLPCPFCGNTNIAITNRMQTYYAYCVQCQSITFPGKDHAEATEKWNRRTP